jgi:hypothetical protein
MVWRGTDPFCLTIGQVTYQTELFLDKNKDYVVAEHQSLLGSSTCPFVAGLFPKSADEGSKSSYKFSSIGTRFKVGKDNLPGWSAFAHLMTLQMLRGVVYRCDDVCE